jgi:lipoprotein signal peptidase
MQIHNYNAIKTTFLSFVLIFIDQISKYIIRHTGGFYICNQNLAFGLRINDFLFYFIWLSIIILLILTNFGNSKSKIINPKQYQNSNNQNHKWFWISNFNNWNLFRIWRLEFRIFKKYFLPLLLILAGGISNLIDRMHYGCVIDFINLKFWPIFNIADIYITIGGIIVLCCLFIKQK